MIHRVNSTVRCGIVLAGGEGKRLQPFVYRLLKGSLPKQYVNFIGKRSMLEHTFDRAEKLIPPDRLFTVVGRAHLGFPEVRRQLSCRPEGTVIIQPVNKETAPGVLLPLVHLSERYPDCTVVVFPSDHFIMEEDVFMGDVELACRAVEQDLSELVLLGIEPQAPDPEYGYLVPERRPAENAAEGVRRVVGFIEKPGRDSARELVQGGALWNSFVMAFRAKALLDLVRRIAPGLHGSFERIRHAIGTAGEINAVEEAYQNLAPMNFSRQILQRIPSLGSWRMSALSVRGVFWSDWGSEQRIESVLRMLGTKQYLAHG